MKVECLFFLQKDEQITQTPHSERNNQAVGFSVFSVVNTRSEDLWCVFFRYGLKYEYVN